MFLFSDASDQQTVLKGYFTQKCKLCLYLLSLMLFQIHFTCFFSWNTKVQLQQKVPGALQEIVRPGMKIGASFAHPGVVLMSCALLSFLDHKFKKCPARGRSYNGNSPFVVQKRRRGMRHCGGTGVSEWCLGFHFRVNYKRMMVDAVEL